MGRLGSSGSSRVKVAWRSRECPYQRGAFCSQAILPSATVLALTFDAEPSTYEFYCRIPGHTAADMKGTLTVR